MARMISIHEYDLRPGSGVKRFEQVIRAAEARGLFELPGLTAHHFARGVKGARQDAYAAVWIYESREAWERLWGTLERPLERTEYPEKWRIWEEELLAPILSSHPDAITFTAYEELRSGA
jgi:heme-degrading monooxygenase HmoA